jgi:hypothetical protein
MTASVQPESKSPTRRALLAGALGGIGAWAAGAIGRAHPARAADGEAVVVGGEYTATSVTKISNLTNSNAVLQGVSSSGTGVTGSSSSFYGVQAVSITGGGLGAFTNSGTGVYGASQSHIGVWAFSEATGQPASLGWSYGNRTGVQGYSGTAGSAPTAKAKTGVYGSASQDATSKGVWGKSAAGHGLHGESSSGWAGYFDGRVLVNRYVELKEIGTPSAPGSNYAKLFIRDNGSGKTQLCVRFHTGAVKVLATQP